MRFAVIDVFYDEKTQTIDSRRYDNAGDGYTPEEAGVRMGRILKHDPDKHYCYLEVVEG